MNRITNRAGGPARAVPHPAHPLHPCRNPVSKLLWFYRAGNPARGPYGFHAARILRVAGDRRRQVKSITVALFNTCSGRFDGAHVRLTPGDWSAGPCGIVWRKRLVPVAEFLTRPGS